MSRNDITVDDDTLIILERWRAQFSTALPGNNKFSWNLFLKHQAAAALSTEEDGGFHIMMLAKRVAALEARLDDEE